MIRPFHGERLRGDLITEVLVLALIGLGLLIAPRGRSQPVPRADVVANVQDVPGRQIPASFLGLSIEYPALEPYAGTDPAHIDPVFLSLIRGLNPGQAPVIRIGGDSADKTWWPVAGLARPAGVTFSLTPAWLALTRAFASSLGARLILGVNLEADSSALAGAEARALLSGIGAARIRALELGNEPELYGRFAWYRTAGGQRVTGRPPGWDYASYTADFDQIASALPRAALAAPSFGTRAWIPHLSEFLAARPAVSLATLHRYPLQKCFTGPASPRYPSIERLLAPTASTGLAALFAPYAGLVHAHGRPLRLDETNSVSCGAVPQVSRSFAAALWAPDAMFELVRAGVDGVNFHSFPGAGYDLFQLHQGPSGWRGSVLSEYYGLLLFAQGAPAGSHLLSVSSSSADPGLKLWATRGIDGKIRVVLIDKGHARSHVVGLRIPGASGTANVVRLTAPGLAAQDGTTLGGQTIGASTGMLSGPAISEQVSASGGRYVLRLPAASAALLTVGSGA